MKFEGTIDALMTLVAGLKIPGHWSGDDPYEYRTNSKALLRWWPSTHTLMFQGPSAERAIFKRHVMAAIESASKTETGAATSSSSKVSPPNDNGSSTSSDTSPARKSRTIYTIKVEVVDSEKVE